MNFKKENTALERQAMMLEASMGRDLMNFMHDENVMEIMLNPDGKIWIDTHSKGCIDSGLTMDGATAKQLIYNVAALAGRTIPPDFPELEAEIPKTYLFDSCADPHQAARIRRRRLPDLQLG